MRGNTARYTLKDMVRLLLISPGSSYFLKDMKNLGKSERKLADKRN